MIKNFRTYNLAVKFYRLASSLELNAPLKDQLNRAASSIVLNLAEGSGRASTADKRRFFSIAFGSLRECQAVLDLINFNSSEIWNCADSLGAHLFKLIKNAR